MDEGPVDDSFTFTFGSNDMSSRTTYGAIGKELVQVRLQVRESKPVTSLLMVCMSNAVEVVSCH